MKKVLLLVTGGGSLYLDRTNTIYGTYYTYLVSYFAKLVLRCEKVNI